MALIEAAERDGRLQARRDDRRADLGQHRHRARDRGAAEGLPRDRGHAGQDVAREDRPPPRLRGRRRARPHRRPPESPQSYYRVADRLTAEIPGAFQPNQYFNPANPQAHYESTGPEIWEQTAGQITHLVAGVGTGGTITGTARYLRERNPDLVVIGADPEGSIYSGGAENVRPYLVEGVGEDFWPETFDPSIIDRWVTVSDRDAFLTTRRLAQLEGILAGGSGGLALHAALADRRRGRGPRRADRGDPPRRRPLIPVEDLLGRVDAPVRLPRPRIQAARRRRARPQARGRRDPAAGHGPDPLQGPRRGRATPRAPRLAAAGGLARTTRPPWSARSASAGCSSAPPRTRRSSTPRSLT